MVQDLYNMIEDLQTHKQRMFVLDQFKHLNPFEAFLAQQGEGQLRYLRVLHDHYVNGNQEAFKHFKEY